MNAFTKLKFDQGSVGSGPYDLHSYSAEKVATVRRDDYWGNELVEKPSSEIAAPPASTPGDHFRLNVIRWPAAMPPAASRHSPAVSLNSPASAQQSSRCCAPS
ncbi:MAG: hypothetical protein ABI895_19285 [Deltaproteobacteria bacterium]